MVLKLPKKRLVMKKYIPLVVLVLALLVASGGWWMYRSNVAGGAVFAAEKCGDCHDLTVEKTNEKGPYLWGIVNRRAASIPDFEYSAAFREFAGSREFSWTEANLDLFITDPGQLIPGTRMADQHGGPTHVKAFEGIKELEKRRMLITYLRTLK